MLRQCLEIPENMPSESEKKEKILNFIKFCEFGVVSTLDPGSLTPESAVVAISQTDNLEIIFASFSGTRKNHNLEKNKNVSIVIGWDNANKTTVQLEGVAHLLKGDERALLAERHCIKNPESRKYLHDSRQHYFKIIPRWIRYSNFSVNPQEVWELGANS